MVSVQTYFQAVIRQPNVEWEDGVCFLMAQFMGDVSEIRPRRLEAVDQSQRILNGGMRWMRFMAQRIEYQHVQALEHFQCWVWNRAEIGDISRVPEPEAENRQASMEHGQGNQLCSPQAERAVDQMRINFQNPAIGISLVKDIGEDPAQTLHAAVVCVNRNGVILPEVI